MPPPPAGDQQSGQQEMPPSFAQQAIQQAGNGMSAEASGQEGVRQLAMQIGQAEKVIGDMFQTVSVTMPELRPLFGPMVAAMQQLKQQVGQRVKDKGRVVEGPQPPSLPAAA